MNSRILIFPPTLYNSLLSLIILAVKLLQIWPAPSSWLLCPCDMPTSLFLKQFLIF